MLSSYLQKLITINLNKLLITVRHTNSLAYDSLYDTKVRKLLKAKLTIVNDNLLAKIKSTQPLAVLDWNLLKKQTIVENSRIYNVNNFEVQLMEHMVANKYDDKVVIDSFKNFIKEVLKGKKNRIIAAHYCTFLATLDPHVNVKEIQPILDVLTQDKSFCRYPVIWKAWESFAAISKDCCDHCLKTIKPLINEINFNPNNIPLSAFKYDFIEEGTQVASKLSSERLKNDQHLFKEWVDCLFRNDISGHYFHQFIKILNAKRVFINVNLVHKLLKLLEKQKFTFVETTVNPKEGKCQNCGQQLETITEEELKVLRNSIQQKLILCEGEVFQNSNPDEIHHFLQFLSKHSSNPFDLVVDSLNISFTGVPLMINNARVTRRIVAQPDHLREKLYLVLEGNQIFEKFKKILIIGKKHMSAWKSFQKLKELHPNQVFIFLLNNESKDDPFILFAAVQSLSTYVLTADYLRDHHKLIKDETLGLFEKWKYCRQIRFAPSSTKKFAYPQSVDYIVQSSDSCELVHFPINTNTSQDKYERVITKWICASFHPS